MSHSLTQFNIAPRKLLQKTNKSHMLGAKIATSRYVGPGSRSEQIKNHNHVFTLFQQVVTGPVKS